MRSLWIHAGLVALIASCGTAPEKPPEKPSPPKPKLQGWKDVAGGKMSREGLFYSETGRFFAAFPGMPQHHSKDIETEVGRVRMESYVYEESVTMAYMVAYTDYPTKYVADMGHSEILARAMDGALKSLAIVGAEKEERVLINGYHGMKYRASGNGQHIVSQLLLVGGRLFQVTLLSDGIYPADTVVDQFINGFHMVTASMEREEWWPEELDTLEKM